MNAFEDDKSSLAGDNVSLEDQASCSRLTKQRFINLFWFLFGICLSGACVFFYGTLHGFGSSNTPLQTYPGPIPITVAEPISGSSCIIEWEKIHISNNYQLLLFQLELSVNAQNWEPLELVNKGFDFRRTIDGLQARSKYIFRLRGCADVGCGNFTYSKCKTELPSIPETPESPVILSFRYNVDMIYFTFNATSADNGGASISSVELRYNWMNNNWLSNSSLGCSFSETCAYGCNCTFPLMTPFLGSETVSFRTQVANHVGKSSWSIPTQCIIFTDTNRNPICVLTAPPAPPVGLSYKTGASNVSIQWTTGRSVNSITPLFFEVWLSDPWNNCQELTRIKNVTDNMYQNNKVLPDTVYKFAVRAFDDVGRPGQMSISLDFKTPVRGDCGNHEDVEHLKEHWDNAADYSYMCWSQNCNQNEECTESCIERVLEFTNGCSKCWYERTLCIIDKCHCIRQPNKCQSCYDQYCLDSYLNCTGLPLYASPPAKIEWTQTKVTY
jgi:hypothetical protein